MAPRGARALMAFVTDASVAWVLSDEEAALAGILTSGLFSDRGLRSLT